MCNFMLNKPLFESVSELVINGIEEEGTRCIYCSTRVHHCQCNNLILMAINIG